MQLTVRAELGDLTDAWDDLARRQPLPSPFLRSWWIDNTATGALVVLALHADGALVGGAAFEVDHLGRGPASVERVRCVGQGPLAPDHLDVIAEPGHGTAVTEAVVGWLNRTGSRLIDLDGLAADGRLGGALATHVTERVPAPWTPLTKDYPAYLAARPGQLRSTLKRRAKHFTAAGATIRRVDNDDATDVARALDALASLHDSRWAEQSGFLAEWVRFGRAAAVGAAAGDVVMHELVDADGEVVAIEADLVTDDRLAFYQAGRRTDRDWRAAGSVVKAHIIDWACHNGFHEFDLLRGDESYKADWATEHRGIVRIRYGHGAVGRAAHTAGRSWRWTAQQLADRRDRRRERAATSGAETDSAQAPERNSP